MGFGNLNALESRLSGLRSNLSTYKSQLDTQKRRRSNIESIIKEMKSVCNNRSDDVNSYLNKIVNQIDDALKGISAVANIETTTTSDKEKDISADNNMNSALSQMQSELDDVERKISELETNINNTNSQISSCQASIRSEQRSIAIDYRNQYNNAQARVNSADAACKADPSSARLRQEFNKACRERDAARANYNKYKGWL